MIYCAFVPGLLFVFKKDKNKKGRRWMFASTYQKDFSSIYRDAGGERLAIQKIERPILN
jgi:hypothetical protein